MKFFKVLFFAFFCYEFSYANYSLEAGLRVNQSVLAAESYQAGVKPENEYMSHLYLLSHFKLSDSFYLRTGVGLVMRDAKASFEDYDNLPGLQSVTILVSRLFLDIPLTISYNTNSFENYFGVNVANKLNSSIDISPSLAGTTNNKILDEKNLVFVPVLGFNYLLSAQSKLGVFYEFEQNFSKNWNQSAYGLTAGYRF